MEAAQRNGKDKSISLMTLCSFWRKPHLNLALTPDSSATKLNTFVKLFSQFELSVLQHETKKTIIDAMKQF